MAGNSELKPLGGAEHCEEMPHFVMEVRPSSIPPALLRLPDDVHVTYESWSKRWQGRSVARAQQLREQIMETMTRQGEGYFTLDEAAQIIADSRPAVDPAQAVKRFLSAHQKGHLTIHQGGTRFRREVNEAVSDFHDVLEAGALDRWLRESTGSGFPAYSPPEAAPPEAAKDRGRRLKRSVLIAENRGRWPTIERDLQDAAAKGLSADAKDDEHGWWWEGSALEWARARGKLKTETSCPTSPWGSHKKG
jgi:hypothetical protein